MDGSEQELTVEILKNKLQNYLYIDLIIACFEIIVEQSILGIKVLTILRPFSSATYSSFFF